MYFSPFKQELQSHYQSIPLPVILEETYLMISDKNVKSQVIRDEKI